MKVYVRAHRKGEGFIGKFIAWFSFGEYKHISMVFEHLPGILIGFEANGQKGVHFFDTDTIGAPNARTFELPCTDAQAMAMYDIAISFEGKKYDWLAIWGFVRRAKREHPDKFVCSEVAAEIPHRVGIMIQRMASWSINPVIYAASPTLKERPDLDV